MSGEAADEFVRIVLNGTEVAVRLTGSAAKNLAALLVEWSRNGKKTYGKTSMMRLLKSGEELQVLSLSEEQYRRFRETAKRNVLYAPFRNVKTDDGKVEVVVASRTVPIVTRILREMEKKEPAREKERAERSKKKDTPSRRFSGGAGDRSAVRRDDGRGTPEGRRESVAAKLESIRRALDRRAPERGGRVRGNRIRNGRSR